ncbi:hypothetical protein [Anaeromicrobium sediminis]|uniref:Uncharacterized protein n=1 Tax=Anaeromicrobium sediminis TaxID=1478221 RepID=A0A267MM38_9FIRM|nr:hypothetical protein [Anaeromicrobium sediminis]PAB60659.1 hypothetical protein CCE28_03715 [Anaeromicrobium sediminis]
MDDNKVICFSCLTAYHIFVSYILSKTVYKSNYKIIILSDWRSDVRKAYGNLKKLNIWDEIILAKENSQTLNIVLQQINELDLKNIDVLHSFSWWGSNFNYHLINSVLDKTKVILTDEGLGTYFVKEFDEHLNKKFNYHTLDFNRVSEIWLFDKQLYISKLNKPLRDIQFKKYIDSDLKFEICDELNIIFDYKHEKKDWDILFLDQSLTPSNITSYIEEKYLLMSIIKAAKDYKVLLKKHPIHSNLKFVGLDVNIIEHNIPWEVIYLNEYIENKPQKQNKIIMTYNSSSFLNTRIIFKDINNNFISLSNLLNNFASKTEMNVMFEKFYEKFKKSYRENFYEVKSLVELQYVLNNISNTQKII